jgi:hypothetical protein
MTFFIEPGQPTPLKAQQIIAADLSDALQDIYSMDDNNRVYLIWKTYRIPLCYKYDLSIIIEDILLMLQSLLDSNHQTISFGSNTFNCTWSMKWNKCHITITAKWNSVVGNIEKELNELTPNTIETSHFIKQWYPILLNIKKGIEYSEIAMIDRESYTQLTHLLTFLST